jgi:hypothetical protein
MVPPLPREALIDSDFLSYRIGFATAGESQQAAKARLKEWLDGLLYFTLKIDDYQLFLTGKGNFRDDIAVTKPYKGNREGFVRPEHYQYLREVMIDEYGASVSYGEEADDVVAYASCTGDYILVHVDKDLDQLKGHHYNPVKNEWYYVNEFEGLYSFYTQMCTGDRTDNIPGLAGIGPAKAKKLLKDCATEEDLAQAVWKAYQDANHGLEYYREQGQLLWLRRKPDELWEPHETIISESKGTNIPTMGSKEDTGIQPNT